MPGRGDGSFRDLFVPQSAGKGKEEVLKAQGDEEIRSCRGARRVSVARVCAYCNRQRPTRIEECTMSLTGRGHGETELSNQRDPINMDTPTDERFGVAPV